MKHEAGIVPIHRLASSRPQGGERILDSLPVNIGPRITTFRGGAVHSNRPPGSQTFVADSHFAAVMLAPCPGMTSAFLGERRRQTFDAPKGMLVISPAHAESSVKWTTPRENAVLAITPDSMLELAAQEFDRGTVDLPILPFGTIDPIALNIAEILKIELTQSEPPNELLVDSLITVFSIHLLRKYGNSGVSGPRTRGGLSVTDARRVQDYMRENFSRM
jgi:AraC family transcriptional regulator